MKVVRERLNEIKRSEDAVSAIRVGYAGHLQKFIRDNCSSNSISRGQSMNIKPGDVAYDLHMTVASAFGTDDPRNIDVVHVQWLIDGKSKTEFIYKELVKMTNDTAHANVGQNKLTIKLGRHFALVTNDDYADRRIFYIFVVNRYISV